MINQYLKYGLRRIWKNKFFSTVNLMGLTVGIAAFLILFIYTQNEKSFDCHFANAQNIYRVTSMPMGIDNNRWARSLGIIHDAASSIPEVKDATWFSHTPSGNIKIGNQQFQQNDILSVDSSFINLFEVKTVHGEISEILAPNTAFVSERFAKKYFKDENPVGKIIEIESLQYLRNLGSFEIRGVVKNTSPKTHFNYEILLSQKGALSERYASLPESKIQWTYNYLLLQKGANPDFIAKTLRDKFEASSLPQIMGPADYQFALTPLTDIHLNSHDRFELKESSTNINVGLLTSISLVILLISLFNFTNLTVAKLIKREQELSLKRSVGATQMQLTLQILTEVGLMCTLSVLLAIGLIELLKPVINQLFEVEFEIYYNEPVLYLSISMVFVVIFVLTSAFVQFLLRKNKVKTSAISNSMLIRPLLIAQVTIVIILIASTFMVNKQIGFIINNSLGFDKDAVVVLHLNDFSKDPAVFAAELEKQSMVTSVGFTMQHMGYPTQSIQLESFGLEGNADFVFANYNYLKTMKISLAENWISTDADTVRGMIINNHLYKSLMEKHGSIEAVNAYMASQPLGNGETRIKLIGVANDFNYNSAHQSIGDFAFWLDESYNRARFIHIRLEAGNKHLAMTKIEEIWNENYPGQKFDFFFLDDQIASQYKAETILSKILVSFSILALMIAIIGISAFSVFISQQRTKEIGIRKVNGAKISEVLIMLNKDFVKWVIIAFAIASPIAYYIMHKWLENFAYKTTLSWWIFALAGLLALGIALLTVSWQSWRAATRNPVEALRYE